MRRVHGFTLIELMVTIAVLGIALGIAVPSFGDWIRKERVRGAAAEVESWVKYARSEATRRNSIVYLLATSGNNWQLVASTSDTACTVLSACDLKSLDASRNARLTLDAISGHFSGTQISPIDGLLTFNGGTNATESVTIGSGSYQLRINVSRTGVTTVCTPSGKPAIGSFVACS